MAWDRGKTQNDSMKPFVMTVIYFLGIDIVRLWIPEPYAAALMILTVSYIFYWVPPKPDMSYTNWMIKNIKLATAVFMIMTVYMLTGKYLAKLFK